MLVASRYPVSSKKVLSLVFLLPFCSGARHAPCTALKTVSISPPQCHSLDYLLLTPWKERKEMLPVTSVIYIRYIHKYYSCQSRDVCTLCLIKYFIFFVGAVSLTKDKEQIWLHTQAAISQMAEARLWKCTTKSTLSLLWCVHLISGECI